MTTARMIDPTDTGASRLAEIRSYTPAGFFVMRACAEPINTLLSFLDRSRVHCETNCVGGDPRCPTELRGLEALRNYFCAPRHAAALTLASESLAGSIASTPSEKPKRTSERRTRDSLFRYFIRSTTRPTPFGTFAGVAVGSFDVLTYATLDPGVLGRTHTRPDMAWILETIHAAEGQDGLLDAVPVVVNGLAYISGQRIVLSQADTYGEMDRRVVSVTLNAVLHQILEIAREPIVYAELRSKMQNAHPTVPRRRIALALKRLYDAGILIGTSRPPIGSVDVVQGTLSALPTGSAWEGVRTRLEHSQILCAEIDKSGPQTALEDIRTLIKWQRQDAPTFNGPGLQVDSSLKMSSCTIHSDVAAAIADATRTMILLSDRIKPWRHIDSYERSFIEMFGIGAEVPVLELLDPHDGLDAPFTYTEPPTIAHRPAPDTADHRRQDTLLNGWVLEAVKAGVESIEVTDERLAEYCGDRISDPLPPFVETFAQLMAPSAEAVDAGEWMAVIAPTGVVYGARSIGRFLHLFNDIDVATIRKALTAEEAMYPGVVFAELSYAPLVGRMANVAIRPILRSYEISVNVRNSMAAPRQINLSDILVGADSNGFYLRSRHMDKRLLVDQTHMLGYMKAPNACRLVLEISDRARGRLTSGLNLRALEGVPFCPRFQRGRVILRPARWNALHSQAGLSSVVSAEAFPEAVASWREKWGVPRWVHVGEYDQRLALDLEHPLCVRQLQLAVSQMKEGVVAPRTLAVEEMLPGSDEVWLRDAYGQRFNSEIVVPMLTERTPIIANPVTVPDRAPVRQEGTVLARRTRMPGTEWVYVKAYASPTFHDTIITRLHQYVSTLNVAGAFFVRYADPEHHIRFRIRLPRAVDASQMLPEYLTYLTRMCNENLLRYYSVDPYVREVERYGGPRSISVIEDLFCADSAAVAELLEHIASDDLRGPRIVVAVASLDRLAKNCGYGVKHRSQISERLASKQPRDSEFHSLRRKLTGLLSPWDRDEDAEVARQRSIILGASEWSRASARTAAGIVGMPNAATGMPETVFVSLAHMHLNRLLGIDRSSEMRVYALWAQTRGAIDRRPSDASS